MSKECYVEIGYCFGNVLIHPIKEIVRKRRENFISYGASDSYYRCYLLLVIHSVKVNIQHFY